MSQTHAFEAFEAFKCYVDTNDDLYFPMGVHTPRSQPLEVYMRVSRYKVCFTCTLPGDDLTTHIREEFDPTDPDLRIVDEMRDISFLELMAYGADFNRLLRGWEDFKQFCAECDDDEDALDMEFESLAYIKEIFFERLPRLSQPTLASISKMGGLPWNLNGEAAQLVAAFGK